MNTGKSAEKSEFGLYQKYLPCFKIEYDRNLQNRYINRELICAFMGIFLIKLLYLKIIYFQYTKKLTNEKSTFN